MYISARGEVKWKCETRGSIGSWSKCRGREGCTRSNAEGKGEERVAREEFTPEATTQAGSSGRLSQFKGCVCTPISTPRRAGTEKAVDERGTAAVFGSAVIILPSRRVKSP